MMSVMFRGKVISSFAARSRSTSMFSTGKLTIVLIGTKLNSVVVYSWGTGTSGQLGHAKFEKVC